MIVPPNALNSLTFPQASLPVPATSIDIVMHPIALARCGFGVQPTGGTDLAVITLSSPVPSTIVEDVARVFLGPIEASYYSAKLAGGTQIGFGKNTSYDDYSGGVDGAGIRRVGSLLSLWPELDPCGTIELNKCNDYLEWHSHVDSSVQSAHAPGDSGGPLFMTHATLGAVVVGVSSGYREDDPALNPDPSVVRADRWLGKQNEGDGAFTTNQAVGYRHCTCLDINDDPLSLTECVRAGGQCNWTDPEVDVPLSRWRIPTMMTSAGATILSPSGFTSSVQFTRNTAVDLERFWRWREDLSTGVVQGKGVCTGNRAKASAARP